MLSPRLHRVGFGALLTLFLAACAATTPPPATTAPDPQPVVQQKAPAAPSNIIRLAAVGDIMMGGTGGPVFEKQGYDYPFVNVKPHLDQADVVIGNLEGPLTMGGDSSVVAKKYVFSIPPDKAAGALSRAGITTLTLANNHILDQGIKGFKDTLAALKRHELGWMGAGLNGAEARKPLIREVNGVKIGFLGYSLTYPQEFWANSKRPGTAFGHEKHIRADVKALRSKVDIVVTSMHWGREGTTQLRDYQIKLAHAAIDSGANLVLGHHPHILQAVERYKKGVILYSLGNFVFGSYSNRANTSAIAAIEFKDGQFHRLEMVPLLVNNFKVQFQPRILQDQAALDLANHLQELSRARKTNLTIENQRAVLD